MKRGDFLLRVVGRPRIPSSHSPIRPQPHSHTHTHALTHTYSHALARTHAHTHAIQTGVDTYSRSKGHLLEWYKKELPSRAVHRDRIVRALHLLGAFLDSVDVPYFVGFGTLLGVWREGGFIEVCDTFGRCLGKCGLLYVLYSRAGSTYSPIENSQPQHDHDGGTGRKMLGAMIQPN